MWNKRSGRSLTRTGLSGRTPNRPHAGQVDFPHEESHRAAIVRDRGPRAGPKPTEELFRARRELLPGKPEKLVEASLFTQVWKREASGWKVARVLSYDHRLID